MTTSTNTKWEEFASHFHLNPKYGYLIDPKLQVKNFDQHQLSKINQILNLQDEETIINEIEQFQHLKVKNYSDRLETLIIHDFLNALVQKYIVMKKKLQGESQIKVPRNIAVPYYQSSQEIGTKFGMNSTIAYLWKPLNDAYLKQDESFGFGDFELKYSFTKRKDQEILFFGGSIIGAFYLARINKLAFEIGQALIQDPVPVDEIGKKLDQCSRYWDKITKENHKIIEELNSQFFFYELRPNLGALQGVIFEGANNGEDVIVSSPGGAGGNDPSFQFFERNFGIKFQGYYKQIQTDLQTGMIQQHRDLLKYLEFSSVIRAKCAQNQALKIKYNSVLEAYVRFLTDHSKFIQNFLFNNMSKGNPQSNGSQESAKGTGGSTIKLLLKRYQQVEKQYL